MTTTTATAPGNTAEQPEGPGPTVGAAVPLSAAYCAERAALCIHHGQIAAADRWIHLAEVLATQPHAHRPRDTDRRES